MKSIDQLIVDTIRVVSAEAIQKADSGHPGLPLGCAPMAYTLWSKHLNHNPANSKWHNRDRFILSAGHGSMLLYALLHIFGYELTMQDLKNFRQFGSKTTGHPEFGFADGVETTTGPLGQGMANAVGMAIAEQYLAAKFNREGFPIVDHYTYSLVGDGCLMEGISSEACSLAGTLGMGKLILLYDSNNITIEGNTEITFKEDVAKRFEAYGWHVIKVNDGNNIGKISHAIEEAKGTTMPSIIIVKNIIGYGVPKKQGTASAHGEPLGEENIEDLKKSLDWEWESFSLPTEVKKEMTRFRENAKQNERSWDELFEKYSRAYPELAKEYKNWFYNEWPSDGMDSEDFWDFEKSMATREASGIVINRLAEMFPNLIGGSADLAPSNKTCMDGKGEFSSQNRTGRNIHYGIREHAMAAIGNGICLHGGLKTFTATFFVFSDYMKGAMRMSALMELPVTYVLTHDSIGVGEDGPTHQPIEQLAALRSMPNMVTFRPCDAKETAVGWYYAMKNQDGPVSLILSRQKLPLYSHTGREALNGAYILKSERKGLPDIILLASGSEVEIIYKAAEELATAGINARVISMPSMELFDKQSEEYKESILPNAVRCRLAVEAGSSFGWHKYIGIDGGVISLDHYGASGKAGKLFEEFGFTIRNVVEKAEALCRLHR